MRYLQQQILNCCYTLDAYQEVKFLEHKDFKNYPDKRFRDYYKALEECKEDELMFTQVFNNNLQLATEIQNNVQIVSAHNLKRYALKLLEIRFEDTLKTLLMNLKTDSLPEKSLIQEAVKLIGYEDIFDLGDSLLDYFSNLASEETKERITSYLAWRDKRIEAIK